MLFFWDFLFIKESWKHFYKIVHCFQQISILKFKKQAFKK